MLYQLEEIIQAEESYLHFSIQSLKKFTYRACQSLGNHFQKWKKSRTVYECLPGEWFLD